MVNFDRLNDRGFDKLNHRKGLLRKMIHIILSCPIAVFHYTRISKDDRVGGDVDVHIAVWGNQYIVTNGDVANDGGVDAYPDLVPYCRSPFSGASVRLTDDNTFVDVAVSAYASIWINGDIIVMTYI